MARERRSAASAASPIASTRSPSPAPRSVKALIACRSPSWPAPELEIRLLVDHRERLVRMRTALNNDLLWHLHDLWPEQPLHGSALLSKKWTTGIARRPARAEQTAMVRIARDELRHLREVSRTIDALEAETIELVARVAPQLLAEPGFGALTAGKLVGEIAGAQRFASDAKLARDRRHRRDSGQLGQTPTATD